MYLSYLNIFQGNVLDITLVPHPSDINLYELMFLGKGIKGKIRINTI